MQPDAANTVVQATAIDENGHKAVDWCAPAEVPIGMVYNGVPHAVMMATPCDLHDFALGFALAEGVINAPDEVQGIAVQPLENGIELHITIPEKRAVRLKLHAQRRAHFGRAGCGLCGVDRLEDAIRPLPRLPGPAPCPDHAAAARAAGALAGAQPLRRQNKSVHGAAWVSADGRIMCVREDIGRHNALDKMIGARAQKGFADGFALLSSRCTFELVQKCALSGIQTLLTLSAPSASAIDVARRANLALACWDQRSAALIRFTGHG